MTPREARNQAQLQLEQQEHQRVMGVMATFNTTTNRDAPPLTPGQKLQIFLRSQSDPWPPTVAGLVAAAGQAADSHPDWGQGAHAYAKRYAASYADSSIGNLLGHVVFPSLLHEDPRYFQKQHGSPASRMAWAAASPVWCRRDAGEWGPNYSNLLGSFIGAAISRAYYPRSERTAEDTLQDGLMVVAEGALGAEVVEFWPSLQRKVRNWRARRYLRVAAKREAQSGKQPAQTSTQGNPPDRPRD